MVRIESAGLTPDKLPHMATSERRDASDGAEADAGRKLTVGGGTERATTDTFQEGLVRLPRFEFTGVWQRQLN